MTDCTSWGPQDVTTNSSHPKKKPLSTVTVKPGLLLEDVQSGWVGVVVSLETIGGMRVIGLEDARKRVKTFPLGFGFLLEGELVKVVAPQNRHVAPQKLISRSGSTVVSDHKAQIARGSRLWVEGIHDAELVEKVWGHDLRVEGIVVEPLHGIDDLVALITAFEPAPERKLGILVDHLIQGSKETRIVQEAMCLPGASKYINIVGHPYVDVWQAIKPRVLGIQAWPEIPRSEEWKKGTLRRLNMPYKSQEDVALGWKNILGRVNSYTDLEPAILGPVESLIDFLTAPV